MATLAAVFVVYLLVVAAVFALQRHLLYYPHAAALDEVTVGGLHAWPSADQFRGLVAEPPGVARGTAIVFHGNAGHAGHRAYYAQMLAPLGWRVILAEYPGYGPRSGAFGETSLVDDAAASLELAYRRYGAPIVVIGESLGAAVAAAAAARQREQTAGLLLITPWDRLAHVAANHYWWLPVRWLLRDPYDTVARLARYDRPVLVVVSERDRVIPPRFGIALHTALAAPKKLVTLSGSGHNDWPDQLDADWWRSAIGFLTRTAP